MSARRFGTQSLVRLLGNWQETSSRTPLWRQLAEALRLLILDGRLTLQTRLPGERELAAALNVSRTTIASALGQLREEGFLYSRQGSGSRIVLPERPADLPLPAGISSTLNLSTAALSAGPEVHQAFQHAMTLLPPYLAQTGYDQQGLPVLREAIARRYSERGLPTRPDEVMVVNGALSAFALILRLFTGPGDRVVIDSPTYPMAISAIQGASCRPVGVALPQQGWDCDGLAATIAFGIIFPYFHASVTSGHDYKLTDSSAFYSFDHLVCQLNDLVMGKATDNGSFFNFYRRFTGFCFFDDFRKILFPVRICYDVFTSGISG